MLLPLAILGGAAISSAGIMAANRDNNANQQQANETQILMANTAHQREVQDLRSAGLNPVLSVSGNGSPVPSLGVAKQENPFSSVPDAINSAAKYMSDEYRAGVENTEANTNLLRSQNSAVKLQNEATKVETEANKARLEATRLSNKMLSDRSDAAESQGRSDATSGMNSFIENCARHEALTGVRLKEVSDLIEWDDDAAVDTYKNLVQMYRNEIQTGRYRESVGRVVKDDVLDVAEAVTGVVGKGVSTAKDIKKMDHSEYRFQKEVDRDFKRRKR